MLAALAEDLRQRGKVDLSEAFIDGTHAGAKRGVLRLGSLAGRISGRSDWHSSPRLHHGTSFHQRSGRWVIRRPTITKRTEATAKTTATVT